ncbi:MAG: M48 family metalloprotease [Actinobacteria bacterium]|nr:M48 family metalloprotease [Actinomycetota bacterium]MBU1945027.1 M48 family metalloprotease [Actinomycetota bacterium]MBU2686637.1 M48 family metalloprotease [Actinomycetota bacterium]
MKIPRESGLEPLVLANIRRCRRRAFALRGALAALLIAAVLAALTTFLVVLSGDGLSAVAPRHWVALGVVAGLFVLFVLIVGPEKVPVAQSPDPRALSVFRNSLGGVSVAVGIEPPDLVVLDLPTANSVSLFHKGRPAVGVTVEALDSALSRRCAEAMMAHEVSHVLLGDVVIGSTRRRWRLVGLSLIAAVVLPFVFLALAFGVGSWTYIGFLSWAAVVVFLLFVLGKRVFRQNDLLADSVAARITADPEGLRDAILRLDRMFLENDRPFPSGARYPTVLFVYEVRPEVDLATMREMMGDEDDAEFQKAQDRNLLEGLRRSGARQRVSTEDRVRNLEAIERGHWRVFES